MRVQFREKEKKLKWYGRKGTVGDMHTEWQTGETEHSFSSLPDNYNRAPGDPLGQNVLLTRDFFKACMS